MVDYAILGGGRLARHFSQYFHLLGVSHNCWARNAQLQINSSCLPDARQRLQEVVGNADRVLLLVSDSAIGELLKQYPFLHDKQLVHCSGTLNLPGVAGVHPLMTFAEASYDLETYQSIPFVVEEGQDFARLFPALPNRSFTIRTDDKALYHAMCVMAGNFSQLLWKGVSERFGRHLELPVESLYPYIRQLASNFSRAPGSSLTGPLVRNDTETVRNNLSALAGDPMQDLYRAFVKYYQAKNQADNPREQVP